MTGIIFKFEFLTAIRKKAYIITMVILLTGLILMSFVPKVVGMINKGDVVLPDGLYCDEAHINAPLLQELTGKEFKAYDKVDALRDDVKNGKIDIGIVIKNGERTLYTKTSNIQKSMEFDRIMDVAKKLELTQRLENNGLPADTAESLANMQFPYAVEVLDTDGDKGFWVIYANLFVLYFLILMFGSQVAMAVAREKSDRTMELLITAAKPKSLIQGKVYAYGALGILTFIIIYGGAFLGTMVGGSGEGAGLDILQHIDLRGTLVQVGVTFAFFILGYIMYLYIYAAAASLVSRLEDVNVAIQPLTMFFMLGFFISIFGMMKPNILLRVGAYFPLTSPLCMPTLYGVESVSPLQVGISFLLLAAMSFLVKAFAVKMYRLGSLNYGNKVSFFKSLVQSVKY